MLTNFGFATKPHHSNKISSGTQFSKYLWMLELILSDAIHRQTRYREFISVASTAPKIS